MEVLALGAAAVFIVAALLFIFRTHASSRAHTAEDRDRMNGRGPVEVGLFSPADAGAEEQVAPTSRPDLMRGD